MPTYRYACQACGHELEEFHSMTAKPLRRCPKCGKSKLERLIGAGAGIIFKGSGFYSTDYRAPAPAAEPANDGKSSEKNASDKGDATKSEGKAGEKTSSGKTSPDSGSGTQSNSGGSNAAGDSSGTRSSTSSSPGGKAKGKR